MNPTRMIRGFRVLIQPDAEEKGGFFGTVLDMPTSTRSGDSIDECAYNVGTAIDELRKLLNDNANDKGVR